MKSDDYFSQDAQDLYEISQEWDGLGISNDFLFGKSTFSFWTPGKIMTDSTPALYFLSVGKASLTENGISTPFAAAEKRIPPLF